MSELRATEPIGFKHARDIPDLMFMQACETAAGRYGERKSSNAWATRWDVERVLGGMAWGSDLDWSIPETPGVPAKVVLAKFRRLKKRGLLDGCDCGCRGDFEITDKGHAFMTPEPSGQDGAVGHATGRDLHPDE